MGTLYIVATPIGNLGDITFRAVDTLQAADYIACEDTRVTQKLLNHFGIEKRTISYHQHSKLQKVEQILHLLEQGKRVAVVSDAGTPGILDPGNQLVKEVAEKLPEVSIVPIPGATALGALASVAGFSMDKFVFLGFPPVKKGRQTFFKEVAVAKYPVVLYESPYRITKTLSELSAGAYVVVGRELTKKFETVYRGTVAQVTQQIDKRQAKGEFVLIVSPA